MLVQIDQWEGFQSDQCNDQFAKIERGHSFQSKNIGLEVNKLQ